jgi:DNA polymerase (family 10)
MKETVGDLDVLTAGPDRDEIIRLFCSLPDVREVLAKGSTKASIITHQGRQVDLRVVPLKSFGAALQYFTGSKAHNIRLRDLAKKAHLKVNEYGVFRGNKAIAGETEESVYAALGLPWIPPEIREDRGEIEAALEGKLPKLLELTDIQGDLHVHTDWSDGHASIEDMARAAKARGYRYLALCDHTRALKIFGGLSGEEVLEQVIEVRKASSKVPGIKLLTGVEVDIKSDGSLDLPDAVLARLDFVTASVHSGFKQHREKMTARIVSALRHEHVDSIGHPTGRLLGAREPYDVDLEVLLQEAARQGKCLEINAHPERLDLSDQACRRARELGVKLVINTDAHSTDDLDLMRFGVATARRGWLEKQDVLNALPLQTLLKKLGR